MDLAAGQLLDRFRLIEPLGSGGQGDVWRAADTLHPGALIALKILRLPGARAVDVDRLRREARALARLEHPSLVRCRGLFEDLERDVLGLVLDLVEGVPLSKLLGDVRLDRHRAQQLLRHVAGALAALHDAGIVHRDVKPSNVLVCAGFFDDPAAPGGVKLIDLGIAAPTGNPRPLTDPGSVVGTIPYMAPEVVDPFRWGDEHASGPRRDVFAFGVLAMELLHGRHPTGLPRGSKLAEYVAAYAAFAAPGKAWPPGVDDDPLAILLERSLALRAADRAAHGRTLVELLAATRVEVPSAGWSPHRAVASASRIPTERPSRAGPTHPDEPVPAPPPTVRDRGSWAPWILAASVIPLAGLTAFVGARWLSPTPSRTVPPPIAPTVHSSSPPASVAPVAPVAPEPAPATCALPGMVLVPVSGAPFCMQSEPVSVSAFRRSMGFAPTDASWPGGVPAVVAVQSKSCRARDPAHALEPLDCVDWEQASAYCALLGGRLPTREQWRAAMQIPDVHPADAFEWTADPREASSDYFTCRSIAPRVPTCDQANPREARNDNLVFRCVTNPG